jgi:cell wall-associated NlpC family hydrolase
MGPTPAAPASVPEPPDAPVSAAAPTGTSEGVEAYALVGTALGFRGTPYRDGGADPSGFDCSGFTQYVFARYGVALPREVSDQYQVGTPVEVVDLRPGDLVFFTTVARGPSHVAIAVGGGEFVHAPSSRGVVRVERLTSSYWSPRYLGARRVIAAD